MNRKYIRNTAILFASMTITKIVGAIFKIPLANVLGGTGMGYFSTAYGLYSPVFALTAAGIPTVMMRITAQNIAAGRPGNAVRTRRTAILLFSAVGFLGSLAVALFAAFFSEHIACSPESTPAVIAIAPAVMLCCIASVIRGYHEGLSDVIPSAAAAVAEAVSRAAVGLAAAYGVVFWAKGRFERGADILGQYYAEYSEAYTAALPLAAAGAIAAVSLSELCGLISLLISDRKRKLPCSPGESTDSTRTIACRLIREIIPVAASALVMNCVSFVDLLTVTRTLRKTALAFPEILSNDPVLLAQCGGLDGLANFMYGSYTGIAMTVFMLIPSFAGMTEKTALPEVAAAWERKDVDSAAGHCCTLFRAAAAIGFPACAGAAALAQTILMTLYSRRAAEVSVCNVRDIPGNREGAYSPPADDRLRRDKGSAESDTDVRSAAEYSRSRPSHRRRVHIHCNHRVPPSAEAPLAVYQRIPLREKTAGRLAAVRRVRFSCLLAAPGFPREPPPHRIISGFGGCCLWNITNYQQRFSWKAPINKKPCFFFAKTLEKSAKIG